MEIIRDGRTAPAAVLWDMDGTLIDSEQYWITAETQLVEQYGGSWSHSDGLRLVGNSLPSSAAILQDAGVNLGIQEIIDALVQRVAGQLAHHIPYRPGVEKLLEECRQAGMAMALVTMSYAPAVEVLIQSMPERYFDVVVTGDQVTCGKPDPEPYAKAYGLLERLNPGIEKTAAIAIEDSVPGVKSAMAAGLKTIAVPNVVDIPESLATVVWDTLEGKGIEQLAVVAFREFPSCVKGKQ